ncbi:MAG: sigma-70 family RNA polymerase sigma factor [Kofleriaceae bacterium]
MELSDQAWIDGVASDQSAVVAELRDYLRRTLARGFGRQLQDADLDDVTQDCLLRVQEKLATFAGKSKFTTWAATIAINTALSTLRRRKFEHVSFEAATEGIDWSATNDNADETDERIALLRRGIAEALTPRQREAVHAAIGGIPLTEIARRYDVTQGAVYKLLHDARRKLKQFCENGGAA